MIDENKTLARGTAVLAISQGCYFVLGYLAVVLLAREFGPAAYGAYGVVMSVLVWLEESGRYAVPSATTKLLAEGSSRDRALERGALTLNLALYCLLFGLLWALAPWLEAWFGIDNGAFLFRVAALDLPVFGTYSVYRAIHQGRQRFLQLGCSQVIYAFAKLVGVLLLINFGLSLENALVVNVVATIIGLACLLPRTNISSRGRWLEQVTPLVSAATPMGVYHFSLLLRGGLVLWTLQIMSVAADTMVGVFVAAYNIARVPALILTTITTVMLPSISRAIALKDEPLAGRHISRSLRFALMLYLPICFVLMAEADNLMQWIYSSEFAGGGVILSLLLIAEGLLLIHAILGTALTAAGEARKAAIVTLVSLLPALGAFILFVHLWGGAGAAFSSALTTLLSGTTLAVLVWRRFNRLMNKRSAVNIALAACLMFLMFTLSSMFEFFFLLSCAAGLAAYFIALIGLGEISRRDFAALLPWAGVQSITRQPIRSLKGWNFVGRSPMNSSAWDNFLKFSILRLWNAFNGTLLSGYRFYVRILRKANRRFNRFAGLQRLINRVFPCPQMVQRYIDPALSIEDFFGLLNKRGVRYAVLRWFEELPDLQKGDDIDLLVHDEDLLKIKDLFVVLPTGVSCDIYSVSALAGASYRGVPLYPSHLACEILETSVLYKETYRVPDLRRYFFSLAYHAIYHKPEESGLAACKDAAPAASGGQRSYTDTLVRLGESIGIKVSPDLRSLHELLTESGWAPRLDVLRRIAGRSPSLTALAAENSSKRVLPKHTIRYPIDVYGVRVLLESNCATFIDYVQRDYGFFHKPQEDHGAPHVQIMFVNATPPWEEIPLSAVPLFKTDSSIVYKQGAIRYVDHHREVLAIYDLKRDEGTVYSNDPAAMYRIAYSMLMTRIGLRLDAMRLHRMHALGITLNETALLFLGHGGCGKSTLGFEMMKHSQVGWLTDDILPVDAHGRALAFPTSPRLIEGSTIPWLPPQVNLLKSPMPKRPPKLQLPCWSIFPRVQPFAQVGALFLCSRRQGTGPNIRRASFLDSLRGICDNALGSKSFGHTKAYHLEFSVSYLYRMSFTYLSRVRTFIHLAWNVPVFRFEMGEQVSENASLLLDHWAAERKHKQKNRSPISSTSAVPSVESRELGDRSGT